MRVEKTVWNSMKAIGGFVVGAVTVFGWLNVTPEMVGQTTYDAMRGPAPLVVMFVSGTLFGWGVTKLWSDRRMKEASEAHDAEIASLKKTKHGHDALFKKFRDLTHDDQRWVVNVLLSEPGGLAPNDEHRAHMGDWVKMKDFLRHNPVGDRLHLVDGIREMLLENPDHVYGLMAARVADLQEELSEAKGSDTDLVAGARMPSEGESRAMAATSVPTTTPGKTEAKGGLDPLVMGRAPRDDFARTLREMDFYTKSTLVAVWEHGAADVTWIDPDDDPDPYDDMFSEMDETFLRMTNARLRDLELFGLVRYETVSGWDRRWTLEDGVADLLAAHGDALAAAIEDAGFTWERLTEIPGQGCPPSDEPSDTENSVIPDGPEVTEAT